MAFLSQPLLGLKLTLAICSNLLAPSHSLAPSVFMCLACSLQPVSVQLSQETCLLPLSLSNFKFLFQVYVGGFPHIYIYESCACLVSSKIKRECQVPESELLCRYRDLNPETIR